MKINHSNNRRDFLKNALTFGAVATITPQLLNVGSITLKKMIKKERAIFY